MQIESLNHSMAEYLDIVDENGIPTGETVERETAHAKGIRHRMVHLWLVRKKDGKLQVLLQRRAKHKESFPDRYDTSSAGHIPAGRLQRVGNSRAFQGAWRARESGSPCVLRHAPRGV